MTEQAKPSSDHPGGSISSNSAANNKQGQAGSSEIAQKAEFQTKHGGLADNTTVNKTTTNTASVNTLGIATLSVVELIELYHADVFRYAFHLSGKSSDAEDISQEAYLQATKYLHQLKDPTKAKAWLLRIVRNCFLKSIQRKRPLLADNLDIPLAEISKESENGQNENADWDAEQLHSAIRDLPEEFRTVVLMHYFEYLPYKEIAAELNVPIGTIMSRLARAKERLRKVLAFDAIH